MPEPVVAPSSSLYEVKPSDRSSLSAAAAQYSSPTSYPRPFLSIETVSFPGGPAIYVIREAINFDEPLSSKIHPLVDKMSTLNELTTVFEAVRHIPSLAVRFWEKRGETPLEPPVEEVGDDPLV